MMMKAFISDEIFMEEALAEAGKALDKGEVPVGAVVVHDGEVIAGGHNIKEGSGDPTAHAEMVAIRAAAGRLGMWRLTGTTVYVTLEPCVMCMGALLQARVSRLVFGCHDPKAGACGSLYDLSRDGRLNHRIDVTAGIFMERAGHLLRRFFREVRSGKKIAGVVASHL